MITADFILGVVLGTIFGIVSVGIVWHKNEKLKH